MTKFRREFDPTRPALRKAPRPTPRHAAAGHVARHGHGPAVITVNVKAGA